MLEQIINKFKYLTFSTKQQQAFLEDIAALVEDGIPVHQAVAVIGSVSEGRLVDVAEAVLARLAEGQYLADGLRGWFPDVIVEVIRTGEEGGALAKTLHAAAASLTQKSSAISSLVGSLTYPLVVFCMGLGVVVFINSSVLQTFADIKPIAAWPEIGQQAAMLGNFVQHWWWMIGLAIVMSVVGVVKLLQLYVGAGRQIIDSLPILSLYRQFTAARFMETLGLLVTNGVILKKALIIMRYNAIPYLGMHLLTMEHRLGRGKENIAEVLDTGLINSSDMARLRVIAKGKGFEYALTRQGRRAGEQSTERVMSAGRLFGGVVMIMAAMLAIFMIFSIYSVGSVLGS